jgi:integrase
MKIDPYKHKERYFKWKEKIKEGIPGISEANSNIIKKYLGDMEIGINIASVSQKGPRGYNRLNNLRDKMIFFSRKFKELYHTEDLTKVTEEHVFDFFSGMENGKIKKEDGGNYNGIDTFVRIFKAFWHWHQKVSRKSNNEIKDITLDLCSKQEKPKWVYLTEEQVKRLAENSKFDYKVLIYFIFDTGIRSPTELINVRVSDLYNDCKELQIREETSKTFGRKIKLMLCSELVKEYIKTKQLQKEDQLFDISYVIANKYLKRLALRVLGDGVSEAGKKYSELSLYDFRHCACCYWLPRYKSESALKYRFGWKKSDKIHYYSELLGMKDTISEEDLLVDVTKTELEKRLETSENEKDIMQDRMRTMEMQMAKIMEITNRIGMEVKQ